MKEEEISEGFGIEPFVDNIEVEKLHDEDVADLAAATKGGSEEEKTGSVIDESVHESQSKASKQDNKHDISSS